MGPIVPVAVNTERLEPGWQLVVKATTAEAVTADRIGNASLDAPTDLVRVRLTLAFAGDVADVAAARSAFSPTAAWYGRGQPVPRVAFILFDADGVVLERRQPDGLEGDITGVGGDAFRVSAHFDAGKYRRAAKIALRFPDRNA